MIVLKEVFQLEFLNYASLVKLAVKLIYHALSSLSSEKMLFSESHSRYLIGNRKKES